MRSSESRCLAILASSPQLDGKSSLSALEVYKACVLVANSGGTRPEEAYLSTDQRYFLDIRREIHAGNLESAQEKLDLFKPSNTCQATNYKGGTPTCDKNCMGINFTSCTK